MAYGPGRYDVICTALREELRAEGVVLLIAGSPAGSGFSVQGTPAFMVKLPQLLRDAADEAQRDLQRMRE